MVVRNRLPPWHEHLQLASGRELLIRPIRPDDALPLRAGFALLQPEEIRNRFPCPPNEFTAEMAGRFARPDPRSEFVLVAAEPVPPGQALIAAVARAAIRSDGREADFAILVSRFVIGQGLGRHLMQRLVRWARGKRLERLHGEVLEHNQPMLLLAQSLGFRRQAVSTAGLVRIVLELNSHDPDASDSDVPDSNRHSQAGS